MQETMEFCQINSMFIVNTFFFNLKGDSTDGHPQKINTKIQLTVDSASKTRKFNSVRKNKDLIPAAGLITNCLQIAT